MRATGEDEGHFRILGSRSGMLCARVEVVVMTMIRLTDCESPATKCSRLRGASLEVAGQCGAESPGYGGLLQSQAYDITSFFSPCLPCGRRSLTEFWEKVFSVLLEKQDLA